MVKRSDIKLLQNWIEGPNTVLKTYAAEGMIRLSNEGKFQVPEEIRAIILEIKQSKTEIPSCTGCVYSRITIEEALADFEFETTP